MDEVGEPSPKSQVQFVITPVDGTEVSVKLVGVPWQTEFEVKFACGNGFTTTGNTIVDTQPLFEVQVKVTL